MGNQIDYEKRIYDSRLGRFLSVDPRQTQFPDLAPYQFAGNTPVQAIDLDGLEPQGFMETWEERTDPYMTKWGYTVQDFYDYKTNQIWTVMNYPNTNQYFYWGTKYEGAEGLFKPHNTSLNKEGKIWTGLFREFKPTHLSGDRSFHYLMAGTLVGVPLAVIYGKAALAYLLSEVVEEAAGVPIPDGPVDLWKYEVKKTAEKQIAKEIVGESIEKAAKRSDGELLSWDELEHRAIMNDRGLGLSTSTNGSVFRAVIQNIEAEYGDKILTVLSNISKEAKSVGAKSIEIRGIEIVNDDLKRIFKESNGKTLLGYKVDYSQGVNGYGTVNLTKELKNE